jgi:hypothetical protein
MMDHYNDGIAEIKLSRIKIFYFDIFFWVYSLIRLSISYEHSICVYILYWYLTHCSGCLPFRFTETVNMKRIWKNQNYTFGSWAFWSKVLMKNSYSFFLSLFLIVNMSLPQNRITLESKMVMKAVPHYLSCVPSLEINSSLAFTSISTNLQ